MHDPVERQRMSDELNGLDATARQLLDSYDEAAAGGYEGKAKKFSDAYHAAIRDRNAAILRWRNQGWGPTEIGRCFEPTMRRTYVCRLITTAREDLRTGKTPAQ